MNADLRFYIHSQNLAIAFRNMARAIGENVAPAFRAFSDKMGQAYETLQRIRLFHALPAWLPWRWEIAQRWPKRWLPSSASVLRWMKGERDGMDQC